MQSDMSTGGLLTFLFFRQDKLKVRQDIVEMIDNLSTLRFFKPKAKPKNRAITSNN